MAHAQQQLSRAEHEGEVEMDGYTEPAGLLALRLEVRLLRLWVMLGLSSAAGSVVAICLTGRRGEGRAQLGGLCAEAVQDVKAKEGVAKRKAIDGVACAPALAASDCVVHQLADATEHRLEPCSLLAVLRRPPAHCCRQELQNYRTKCAETQEHDIVPFGLSGYVLELNLEFAAFLYPSQRNSVAVKLATVQTGRRGVFTGFTHL